MSARTVSLVLALGACRPTHVDTPPVETPTAASSPQRPSRHAAGEVLDANIPMVAGGVLATSSLRGKVVILELVDAGHRDAAAEADYTALVESSGDALAVVMVALDAEAWRDDVPPYLLGWDPQGALAARLHAATLPTVLVLDRQGRIAHQYGGSRAPGHAEVIAAARRLLTR